MRGAAVAVVVVAVNAGAVAVVVVVVVDVVAAVNAVVVRCLGCPDPDPLCGSIRQVRVCPWRWTGAYAARPHADRQCRQ